MADSAPVIIRVGLEPDVDPVWKLVDACRSALRTQGIAQWDELYPTADTVRADIDAARLFVLMSGERYAGVITLDGFPDPSYASLPWAFAEPALIVHRLCIDPTIQRRGFGCQLMGFAEQYAADNSWRSIRLDAYSGNPSAIAFYRQRGYHQVGELFFSRRPLPFYLFERAVDVHPDPAS